MLIAQLQDWTPVEQGGCMVDGIPTLKCFEVVTQNILTAASVLTVVVLFIMLVYGSFMYMISLGNPDRVKKAQGTLRNAVIGLALFLAAFLIIRLIDVIFLGGQGTLLELNFQ